MGEFIKNAWQNIEPQKEGDESDKNAREHLDFRLQFAEAVSQRTKMSISETLFRYTDMFLRLNLGSRAERSRTSYAWNDYLSGIDKARSHEAALAWTVEFYKKRQALKSSEEVKRFGPFRYDVENEVLDIHFGSMDWSGNNNVNKQLETELFGGLRKYMKELLLDVKANHPEVTEVMGGSWLYGRLMRSPNFLPSLKEIFPPEFLESTKNNIHMVGGGRWGQFNERDGSVNQRRKIKLLENVRKLGPTSSHEEVLDVFPEKPIMLSADIGTFYRFYGIE